MRSESVALVDAGGESSALIDLCRAPLMATPPFIDQSFTCLIIREFSSNTLKKMNPVSSRSLSLIYSPLHMLLLFALSSMSSPFNTLGCEDLGC